NLLELKALAELGRDKLRLSAVHIAAIEPAVRRAEELFRCHEALLREQRRQQSGERAAALMKLHRRSAPGRERAGRLAARKTERPRQALAVEAQEPADRGSCAERPEHTGPMPALRAEHCRIEADADARHHLAAGRDGGEHVGPREPVALSDQKRWR